MALQVVQKGKGDKARRTMLYGTKAIGKSTFAANAPSPFFVDIEDGLDNIDCSSSNLIKSFDEVVQILRDLYSEKHDFKTVVIDSLDWLERLIHDKVCEEKNKVNIEDIGFAKGYTFAMTHWNKLIDGFDALRNRGMHILLIAHEKIEKFDNPDTDSYVRYSPRLHKTASSMIQEWCDEVFFACRKIHTKQSADGFKSRTQAVGGNERVIRTEERATHLAKNRLQGLPYEIPLSWDAYSKYFKKEK